ncbi:MAG: NADP-dependent phosphogluconate dehydrogenase [Armatimonadetes bacterium]|nr:NADP-dependent phosphogluconate dehydrogenase [Armatimonadota bacterium]
MAAPLARFGMVGLGTMGRSLLLNILDHGYPVSGLDTDPEKVRRFNEETAAKGGRAFTDAKEFVASLQPPRTIMMLVPAGAPVDSVIANLRPLLEKDDFLIDGGNSFFRDTERRTAELESSGLGFIGIGVSGGEAGARTGPSMMAGGTAASYGHVQQVLEAVAARSPEGRPCVARLGPGGAGHYVKMVHNGIEYGMMQLLAEAYDLMRRGHGLSMPEAADFFASLDDGEMGGFLVEIAAQVLRVKDDLGDGWLVDKILDQAKQKGTGKWTSQEAMDLGIPIPTIDAAVSARQISALRADRLRAEGLAPRTVSTTPFDANALRNGLKRGFLACYAQGFSLLRAAATEHNYGFDLEACASVWRAGCIIRSALIGPLQEALRNGDLPNVLLSPVITKPGDDDALRAVVSAGVQSQVPLPCFSASLAYVDGLFTGRLPANFIQAQRDFFGAHTYERTDQPGTFHSTWGQA